MARPSCIEALAKKFLSLKVTHLCVLCAQAGQVSPDPLTYFSIDKGSLKRIEKRFLTFLLTKLLSCAIWPLAAWRLYRDDDIIVILLALKSYSHISCLCRILLCSSRLMSSHRILFRNKSSGDTF